MDAADILHFVSSGFLETVDGVDPLTVSETDGFLTVSDLCVLPVFRTSSKFERGEDLEILDDSQATLATLCLTKGETVDDIYSVTAWRYAAFLADVSGSSPVVSGRYTFTSDYVVVDRDRLQLYIDDYWDGAPIWGGYSHDQIELSSWTKAASPVQARAGLSPPTDHHKEAFQRYLSANNSFDRFLRLYHCVELLFDFVTFKKIQKLGDDLVGYGELTKDLTRGEYDRLLAILVEFCDRPADVGAALNQAAPYASTCKEIFQDYSKDSNPLKGEAFSKFWTLVEGTNVAAVNFPGAKLGNAEAAQKLIIKIAAYWIYRVRCSIAHNRVGEFILTDAHDDFVGSFATTLLATVVEQILSNSEFKDLAN